MKVKLNLPWPPAAAPGETESHYGFPFLVGEDGGLTADIDDAMAAGEIAAGRMVAVDAPKAAKAAKAEAAEAKE